MLINKDCYYAIKENLKEYTSKIDLIYIDPPFATGKQFKDKLGNHCYDDKNFSTKEYNGEIDGLLSFLKIKDFEKDYLKFMYPRLCLLKELLSDRGSIYVHCDWHIGHYLKIILDEIFGKQNFINEIVWCYKSGGAGEKSFAKKHDTLYLYSKTNNYIFNSDKERSYFSGAKPGFSNIDIYKDEEGKWYSLVNTKDWWDLTMVGRSSQERVDYPTQKPEKLLERIIKASSNPNSIVLDCFCGSGTTLAVAEKLGRKWIGCDKNPISINVCKKRIDKIKNPFKDKP